MFFGLNTYGMIIFTLLVLLISGSIISLKRGKRDQAIACGMCFLAALVALGIFYIMGGEYLRVLLTSWCAPDLIVSNLEEGGDKNMVTLLYIVLGIAAFVCLVLSVRSRSVGGFFSFFGSAVGFVLLIVIVHALAHWSFDHRRQELTVTVFSLRGSVMRVVSVVIGFLSLLIGGTSIPEFRQGDWKAGLKTVGVAVFAASLAVGFWFFR